jgi:hypothetical protein
MIFLLIQNDKIVGGAAIPKLVPFDRIDSAQSWQIVAGIESREGHKIIGPICEFHAKVGAKCYRLTSMIDGWKRLVGRVGTSVEVAIDRLDLIDKHDGFTDHANLEKLEIWDD